MTWGGIGNAEPGIGVNDLWGEWHPGRPFPLSIPGPLRQELPPPTAIPSILSILPSCLLPFGEESCCQDAAGRAGEGRPHDPLPRRSALGSAA